jgi:hypothetical protein
MIGGATAVPSAVSLGGKAVGAVADALTTKEALRAAQFSKATMTRATFPDGAVKPMLAIEMVEGNAYSFASLTHEGVVRALAARIMQEHPWAMIYLGTGGHGAVNGVSFITEASFVEKGFLAADRATAAAVNQLGIGRVLDLTNPAYLRIFQNAEALAKQGGDTVFTIRAWCYSCRTNIGSP